jgi:hypothetical protein
VNRPPEGRIRLVENGPLSPGEQRGDLDGLCVVEVDGEVVCHIPTVAVKWEVAYTDRTPRLTITTLAGKSELTSREENRQ